MQARRFSNRTLLLMVLAVLAFGRFWCATHRPETPTPVIIDVLPSNGDR